MVCVCHLPDHIPCRRPQPVFRGRPPRRQFAASAYRLQSPWLAAPMAHESIEGERVPTEMCDHSHQKPRRIVGQHEQARTPGPRSGGAFLQRWTSDGGRARWCPTRRVLVVPKVELAPRDIVSCVLGCLGFGGFIGVSHNFHARFFHPRRQQSAQLRAAPLHLVCGGASSGGRIFAGNDPSRASDDTERSAAREERHSSRAAELLSFALRAAAAPGRRHSRGPLHWRCARWPSVHPVAT